MMMSAPNRLAAGPLPGDRPPVRGGRPGFTIPELLVVLVIVGVLSVLVVPQMEIVKYRMDGTTRGVMMALVTAQRAAVKRQHPVVVAFDTVNGRIRIHEDQDSDGVRDDGERIRQIPLGEDVIFGVGAAPPRTYGSSAALTFTETQDGLPAVRFLRNGSASQDGWFYITSTRSIRGERFAKDSRSIQVDRATGRASWFYYDPPEWKLGF